MFHHIKIILITFLAFACTNAYAQFPDNSVYRSPVRKILNKFSLNLSTGYGATRYSHSLEGFNLIQLNGLSYIIPDEGEPVGRLSDGILNWFNDPTLERDISVRNNIEIPENGIDNPVNNPLLIGANVFNGDSLGLRYTSISHSLPINFSLHFNIQKFRIGAGIQYEKQWIRPFRPNVLENDIANYEPNITKTNYFRFYGVAGYQFYSWWDYTFAAELQIGSISGGKGFNTGAVSRGLVTNIGVTIEDNWSEYFRITLKPSIDIKSFSVVLPEGPPIRNSYHAFYLQVGISFTFPEIPRSPIKNDHIQLKHIITHPKTGRRVEVRGQPFWKVQNPKVGQNHKKVLRNKGKNKKKFNPF